MVDSISDVARRLAENAEAVCRHYLPNGRREGRYWLVGDVHNTPGRSLYVRLSGSACDDRAVGRWTDAADGSAWGSARSDRRCAQPGWHRRSTGRGKAVSRPGTIGAVAPVACFRPVCHARSVPAPNRAGRRPGRNSRSRAPAVPEVIADRRHARQHLSGGAWDRRGPGYDRTALSSALLVPAGN